MSGSVAIGFGAGSAPVGANYIVGEWRPSRTGRTYERRDPWGPSQAAGEFPSSGAEDVDAAVEAAERARPTWVRTPAAQRCAFLARAADAIEARVDEDRG
jgi:aldehyde dehydrogenase (NAD+)